MVYPRSFESKTRSTRVLIEKETMVKPSDLFARLETVRTVTANEKLQIQQFDIKTAFLYGNLKEEVYLNRP